LGDRLKELYRDRREEYISVWQDVGTFVKFGSLNDEKFKNKSKISLSIAPPMRQDGQMPRDSSCSGAIPGGRRLARCNPIPKPYSWLPTLYVPIHYAQEYLERNKDTTKIGSLLHRCSDTGHLCRIAQNQGLEVLFMDSFIDNFISRFGQGILQHPVLPRGCRPWHNLDWPEQSWKLLIPRLTKPAANWLKSLFEKLLISPRNRTEALKSDDPQDLLPAEFMRRMAEMNAWFSSKQQFPEEHICWWTLLTRWSENLVEFLIIQGSGQVAYWELANLICHHVYDLALMAQKGWCRRNEILWERSNQV